LRDTTASAIACKVDAHETQKRRSPSNMAACHPDTESWGIASAAVGQRLSSSARSENDVRRPVSRITTVLDEIQHLHSTVLIGGSPGMTGPVSSHRISTSFCLTPSSAEGAWAAIHQGSASSCCACPLLDILTRALHEAFRYFSQKLVRFFFFGLRLTEKFGDL